MGRQASSGQEQLTPGKHATGPSAGATWVPLLPAPVLSAPSRVSQSSGGHSPGEGAPPTPGPSTQCPESLE